MSGGVTIYHNPKCGTSRTVLGLIEAAGVAPDVVLYLETGWDEAELARLMARAGVRPHDWLRLRGTPAEDLRLTGADVPDEVILKAMAAYPILVERPIVETAKGVALCRPAEKVATLF